MIIRRLLFTATAFYIVIFLFIYSCGKETPSSFTSRSISSGANYEVANGIVRVAITGNATSFSQINSTIERVEVIDDETGAVCEVVSIPSTINAADLTGLLQIIGINKCTPGLYTGARIELDKSIQLSSTSTGSTAACSLDYFKNGLNEVEPLVCNEQLCTIEIKTDVNVTEGLNSAVVLFFDIAASDITNVNDSATCSAVVTLTTVSTNNSDNIPFPESVTGLVSELTTTTLTFSLVRGDDVLPVDYSGTVFDKQPGVDALVKYAETESLRTKIITSSNIQINGESIPVNSVYVKVQGIVSELNTETRTLTVTEGSRVTSVDYSQAVVNGMLADGGCVKVRLYGSDGTRFLASRIDTAADDSGYS